MLYTVIMAGGSGKRFWPASRAKTPKQLLAIASKKTMMQETAGRVAGVCDNDQIYVVTNEVQGEAIKQQLSEVPGENIIIEPFGRNTAACIGLAALYIAKKNPDGIMAVMPADHAIKPVEKFTDTLKAAAELAKENVLVTFGIKPTFPATGYGYIQKGAQREGSSNPPSFKVEAFKEKPDLATAEEFLRTENFFWNSGVFVWKAQTILDEFKQHMPKLYDGLQIIGEAIGTIDEKEVIRQEYEKMESISIDHGVMEKSDRVFVIEAIFDWDDVGSWRAVERHHDKDGDGNVVIGTDHIGIETKNCIIKGGERLITTVGIDDLIIVDMKDSLLICRKDKDQKVKDIVDILEQQNRKELL